MNLYPCCLVRSLAVRRVSIILACWFLIATRLAAAATLAGQVTDPDGRGINAARILVVNALGVVAEAVTESGGIYEIAQLDAGAIEYANVGARHDVSGLIDDGAGHVG